MASSVSSQLTRNLNLTVRSVEGEDHLNLIFHLKGRYHNLLREKEESVKKTLKRLVITAFKPAKAKRSERKHIDTETIPIEAHLYNGEQLVPDDTPNAQAWVEGRVLLLDGFRFTIEVNPPTILSLKLPDFAMSGCPTAPEVEVEFTDPYLCKWTWKRYPTFLDPAQPLPDSSMLPTVGNTFVYWPSSEDVGHRLLLECIPTSPDGKRTSAPSSVISPVLLKGPTVNPITRRHLLTPARLAAPDQFRVVTYNTLAEPFTSTEDAREKLYPYCDPSALDIDYRQCLVIHELLGYNADVICLQEVTIKTFERFFLPSMKDKGYDGYHCPKSGMVSETVINFTVIVEKDHYYVYCNLTDT